MDLNVDKSSEISVGEQLVTQIKLLVRVSKLSLGEQLPTAKELAASLNLNYNTVADAYRKLERQGYVVQNRRAGTHVAATVPADPTTELVAHVTADMGRKLKALNAHPNDITKMVAANLALNVSKPLTVAVLASTLAEASQAATRTQTILGDAFRCVPQTPDDYRSADYHLSVISPELAASLAAPPSPRTMPMRAEVYSAAFPAGAD